MTFRLGSLAVVTIAALATSCGTQTADTDHASSEPTHTAPTDPAPTESPTGTTPENTTPPTEEPSGEPSGTTAVNTRPSGLKGRLLAPDDLPGPNSGFTWKTASTTAAEGADLAGTCHTFAMTSVGAWKVVRRTYAPAVKSPSRASELVAEFPDVKTAKRVYAVLTAWHDSCAAELAGKPKVGDFVPVGLGAATGGWYLLTYGSTFDAQGIVRNGARIAVLTMRTEGQDYSYPAGKEPMVAALKRATTLL